MSLAGIGAFAPLPEGPIIEQGHTRLLPRPHLRPMTPEQRQVRDLERLEAAADRALADADPVFAAELGIDASRPPSPPPRLPESDRPSIMVP